MKAGADAKRAAYRRQQTARRESSARLLERIRRAAAEEADPDGFWTVVLWEDYGERVN